MERARKVLVGGVNSPVRAFKAVGGEPVVFQRGQGPWLFDVDGRRYLDMVSSWGPLILGHCDPEVVAEVCAQVGLASSFGATCELEVLLAELITSLMPSIERLRFVSSGTEATMSAVRLARGVTGRRFVVKCAGCYHGHADGFLIKAGSGGLTLGVPDSKGVSPGVAADTLVVDYNALGAMTALLDERGADIAAVILEPVAGNMGVVPPAPGYLEGVRAATRKHGILLILDEVITGFRLTPGGAQAYYGLEPDLTCLGKIIGGGFPVGAYGASAAIMNHLAPLGGVYQAGTLSGNPVSMAAGLATLRKLIRPEQQARLAENSLTFRNGLSEILERRGWRDRVTINAIESMFTVFFSSKPIRDNNDLSQVDTRAYERYFQAMLQRGIYLPPSAFEACFASCAQGESEVGLFLQAFEETLTEVLG